MKIAIGSDHAGYELKEFLKKEIDGVEFFDVGTKSEESCDYPDYAHPVAEKVENKEVDFGILICGSGNGISMAANKHKGIRAALSWKKEIAELARLHNNANIVSLPARYISNEEALEIVNIFLKTPFEGGRHQRRVEKI